MNRRFFLSLTALPLLSACAAAMTPALTQAALTGVAGMASNGMGGAGQPQLTFSSITVNTNRATYDTALAEGYSNRLGNDLKAALEDKFKNRMSRMGLPLIVDINRLGISGAITTAVGEGQSVLTGRVRVRAAEGSDYANHQVSVSPSGGSMIAGALLGGGSGALGQDQTYGRLISLYADEVEKLLVGSTGIGSQILSRVAGGL